MKKILLLVLSLAFLGINVSAYELPKTFWKTNGRYVAALESGDLWGIIENGMQTLDLLANEPENEQVLQVKGSRLEQIAIAYEKLGEYNTSADYFERYAVYAEKLGWDDAVKICKAKVLQYRNDVRVFTETTTPVFSNHGKLEPDKGVMFGITSDSPEENKAPGESMILLYLEFGNRNFDWAEKVFNDAERKGQAIELAWNVPGEGNMIGEVPYQTDHIISVLKLIESHNTVPVYIRFGAEVNIWNVRANPQEYIAAFRTVAELARQYTTNTAMVWSVNTVSAWDIEMNDFYPGDEYVDWVGVSLYMQKYFLGRNDWPENEKFNEVVFLSGRNADPVKALNEVMEKYGDRKPIMISESGASHYIRSVDEYDTPWAKIHLKKLYDYVPMVYPQVKLIAYFDKVITAENNDYAFSTNEEMARLYKELVSHPQFIHSGKEENVIAFEEIRGDYQHVPAKNEICTYVHIYGDEEPKVCYYIDDVWAGASTELPYRFRGLADVSEGNHTLKVAVEFGGLVVAEKILNITVTRDISIVINGKSVATDTAPVVENGRTLVPVRVVANGLGAEVEWVAETREIIIRKQGDVLTMQIDNPQMVKNGNVIALDAPPKIINSRTMVPLRAVGEALNAVVEWDGGSRTVYIAN